MGNLTDKAFPGVGDLTLPGWGRENCFFVGAPKALTAINTCLDEMEEFKGRDTTLQKKLTKKGLQK